MGIGGCATWFRLLGECVAGEGMQFGLFGIDEGMWLIYLTNF